LGLTLTVVIVYLNMSILPIILVPAIDLNGLVKLEHPEKNGWCINELEYLGVDTKSNADESNNKQDNSELIEAIKQTYMEEYTANL
jgi:hypothetical protein